VVVEPEHQGRLVVLEVLVVEAQADQILMMEQQAQQTSAVAEAAQETVVILPVQAVQVS
jgi:hypothetical protein